MMRKNIWLSFSLLLVLAFNSMAQTTETKEANPADVGSLDAIIKAVYDVISGDAGQTRDWDRFRTLFHRDARMIPSGKNPQSGLTGARALTPEDYIKRTEPFLPKKDFTSARSPAARKFTAISRRSSQPTNPFTNCRIKSPLCGESTVFNCSMTVAAGGDNDFLAGRNARTSIPRKYLKNKD
jgi:hypothetical protein